MLEGSKREGRALGNLGIARYHSQVLFWRGAQFRSFIMILTNGQV